MRLALQVILLSILLKNVCSFACFSHRSSVRQYLDNQSHLSHLYLASKDDEIAALEERLRILKQEAAMKERDVDIEPAQLRTVFNEPLDEMLTEKWKENESESVDAGGFLKNLIGIGVLFLVSIAVSQIPTGQEGYDKYTAVKPNTSIDLGDLNLSKSSLNGL